MVPDEAASYYKNTIFSSSASNLRWIQSVNGEFSSKRYLQLRRRASPEVRWGGIIWQQWLPPRFSLLVWRIVHHGLPMDDQVRRLGVHLASRCACCLKEEESSFHLFFEGRWAVSLWSFLEDTFESSRPLNLKDLVESWLNSCHKKKAKFSLKLGLTCIGLHYIWQLRNKVRHDEQTTFDCNELINWAAILAKFIPKNQADSPEFRRIQMRLRIPYTLRSTIPGRWSIWKPDRCGYTMDVAISEECNSTAILIRAPNGSFVEADRKIIEPIQRGTDLDNIIDSWRLHTNYNISTIIYSHHFTYSNIPRGKGRCVVRKAHPLLLRAALSLCYSKCINRKVDMLSSLPLATRKLIWQDGANLCVFCPTVDDSKNVLMDSSPCRLRDDNSLQRNSRLLPFIDDTNI